MKKNLLLTGNPGVGKTTLVRKVVEQLHVKAGGFFTEEMREGGQRVGFKIKTLDGQEGLLAHVSLRGRCRVGRYCVSVEDMERVAVPALERAMGSAELIVIDEVAKMELFCPAFHDVVRRCLNAPKPVLAVIQKRCEPFLNEIRGRSDVELIEVTLANRNELARRIAERVRMWLP